MTAANRLPLPFKLAYTAFMAVLVPVYWYYYGPTNFLYFCDAALFITLVGLWLESPLLAPNPGNPYLVISPFGVDGIAFDKNHKNLYVGNLDYGRIVKIEVKHGDPNKVSVFYENIGMIGGVDGLAFDDKENLYLAVHGQDRIVSLDKKAKATNVHTGAPLQQPSSLVFGATQASKHTLYISNFSILAVFGVKPGPPTPGLLKLTVPNEGLELP